VDVHVPEAGDEEPALAVDHARARRCRDGDRRGDTSDALAIDDDGGVRPEASGLDVDDRDVLEDEEDGGEDRDERGTHARSLVHMRAEGQARESGASRDFWSISKKKPTLLFYPFRTEFAER
jgi:hypothetical protein